MKKGTILDDLYKEFDRQFKIVIRLTKEHNFYKTLKKYLLYKQSYKTMRDNYVNGVIKTFDGKINLSEMLNYVYSFEPAYKEFGYDYWEKNIREISHLLNASKDKILYDSELYADDL